MVGLESEIRTNEQTNSPSQAQHQSNQASSWLQESLQEEPIGVLHSQSTFRNKSPSPNQVQKQHEDRRTVGSANPVKMRLYSSPHENFTGQSTCIWIPLRHYKKRQHGNTHNKQCPQGRLKRQMLAGNQKQPKIKNQNAIMRIKLGNQFIVPSSMEALQVKSNGLPQACQGL